LWQLPLDDTLAVIPPLNLHQCSRDLPAAGVIAASGGQATGGQATGGLTPGFLTPGLATASLVLLALLGRPAFPNQPPSRPPSESPRNEQAGGDNGAPQDGLAVAMFGHLPPDQKLQMFQRLAAALGRVALACEPTEPQVQWLERQRLLELLQSADQSWAADKLPEAGTPEQPEPIAAIFEKLDSAFVDPPNGPRQLRRPANAFMDDLEQLALWQLELRLGQELSEQQLARLQAERQAREAFMHRSYQALLEWVIDREVILRESQKAAIRDATRTWIEQHGKSLQFYVTSDHYVPDLIAILKPILDPQQSERWSEARGVNVGVGRNVHWANRFREILLEPNEERRP